MRVILYITFVFTISFYLPGILPVSAVIQENPLVPYIDSGDGRGVNPGDTQVNNIDETNQKIIEEKEKKNVADVFRDLFGINENQKFITPVPSGSLQQPTVAPGNPNNLLPTGVANPSITYFPQPDTGNLLNNGNLVYPEAMLGQVRNCLPNKAVYETAATHTGVPWTILASLHYTETGGKCGANLSSVSGNPLGSIETDLAGECSSGKTGLGVPKAIAGGCTFDNLLDSLVYSGIHIKQKNTIGQADGIPRTHEELVFAVSKYNGGGNSNCRTDRNTIAPYYYVPGNCPELFVGESDTYVFNKTPDGKHGVMYIRFCDNGTTCGEIGRATPIHQVLGVLTVAGALSKL